MKNSFTTNDFNYELPDELIARYPLPKRTQSRLLCVNRAEGTIQHFDFNEFVNLINSKDLLIFNDTKVIAARLFGQKASGGKIECLIERIIKPHEALAHIRASHAPHKGSELILAKKFKVRVLGKENDLYKLEFITSEPILEILNQYGEIPLPHYMERKAEDFDYERYQTIFAKKEGAVAAPTAALHFDADTLTALEKKGVEIDFITLHVGAGTFKPVRVESLEEHVMHSEFIQVSDALCKRIKACKKRGGRVIAVGTTVVRSLETAAAGGEIKAYQGDTNIFIYPGYQFRCIDGLLTNFHLPKSTLLMLVTAWGGYELIMRAYQEAIARHYRFFSYGDAMLVV